MTPAVETAEAAGVAFEVLRYRAGSGDSWGREAIDALGLDPDAVFKTLVARLGSGELVVAVVPVEQRLDLKALAAVAGAKSAAMASEREAQRATGYVVGGISPLGQRTSLRTFVDAAARSRDTVYVSGGRRGLELVLRSDDLIDLCRATVASLSR